MKKADREMPERLRKEKGFGRLYFVSHFSLLFKNSLFPPFHVCQSECVSGLMLYIFNFPVSSPVNQHSHISHPGTVDEVIDLNTF